MSNSTQTSYSLAKVKWAQARAAVTAGAGAWQNGNSAQRVGSS
jgi:hypothetical protein